MVIIKVLRKIKANLLRFRFHILFGWFFNHLLTLCYLSRLSKWVSGIHQPEFNDFYAKCHNYNKRYDLYKHIVQSENLKQIYYLEFGVSQGFSFKWWVENIRHRNSKFVGFDTFTGLPEDWGHFKKGDMSAEGSFPEIDDNRCEFVRGVFQATLPSFMKSYASELRKVVHLDADIYSSTLFVLTIFGPYLKKGDILIFDEFNVPLHEFKAFTEFTNSYYVKTKIIGAVNNFYQTAFRIEENLSYNNKWPNPNH